MMLLMLSKEKLQTLYFKRGKSMQDIATILNCSLSKIKYWMEKYSLQTRSISEAIYLKHNPDGDPFRFRYPKNIKEGVLFGLGLGLYWGEGTKANLNSIRLGNTDPQLIKKFIEFLVHFFSIKKRDFKFGLQLFKPTITKSGSIGTYKKKSKYGVITVMYHNKKLRNLLVSLLPM